MVGTGTQLVIDGFWEVVDGLVVLVGTSHSYTEVEIVGDGPDGGYLDLQPEREHLFPGHELLQ